MFPIFDLCFFWVASDSH